MAIKKELSLKDIHLSKGISELEQDVESVWEPPDIYDDVIKDNVWLIYGKKGSGKSHLVDFLRLDKKRDCGQESVFAIRPREDRLFQLVMSAINEVKYDDERIIIENIAASLEFVIVSLIMRESCDLSGFLPQSSNRKKIYNFLVNNHLSDGSLPRKAIQFLAKLTGGQFKLVRNLADLLDDNKASNGFVDAKNSLWYILKKAHGNFIICIDDIDEIGFSFSRVDRFFVNALIVLMLRLNLDFCRNKLPIRVLLTSPSELFFHSTLWGDDWVEAKSRCLRWLHHETIQRIVNKRIAKELNIKKNNPRTEYDIYSDSTQSTWMKLFPSSIENKIGKNESAIIYILRHTFYTPRHVLEIADKILRYVGSRGYTLGTLKDLSQGQWNDIFQDRVEEYTYNIESSFQKLYGKIYDGIEDVFYAFSSRPSIWTRPAICDFIERRGLKVIRRDSGKVYSGDALVNKLQHLGFLGLGTQNYLCPPMSVSFNLRFSFLEKLPSHRPWEIAVISPIFFDPYSIRPVGDTIVVPHETLTISSSTWKEILRYRAP